ncbi:MAG: hypothetical protein RSI33_03105 [Clostridia bacterium]
MRQEMKRVFCSLRFWVSVFVLLMGMLSMTLPEWLSIEWADTPEKNAVILVEGMSSLQYAVYPIYFGGFMLLFPFCACFPYAGEGVKERQTGYLWWMVQRTSLKRYVRRKITVAAVSGACACMLPFLLHALLWWLLAAPSDPDHHMEQVLTFGDGCFYNEWYKAAYGLPMYMSHALGIGFTSSVWSVAALAVSIWLPDQLLTLVVPSGIFYLWLRGLPNRLTGLNLPSPVDLFNDGLTWPVMASSVTVYLCLLLLAIVLYWIGLRRCTQHG